LDKLQQFLLIAPVLLFSMVAHEYAHGYAALKQGDPTAFQLGRLTWNPIKHIDPFMTVLMPIMTFYGSGGSFMFGGAKPVPVVPRNYKRFKRGDIIVSLAGIVTNLGLAIVCTVVIVVLGLIGRGISATVDSMSILQTMMLRGVIVNLVLAIFNLMPIPPLDGSHVMKYLLPPAWALRYQQLGRYGILILVFLLATNAGQGVIDVWMQPVEYFGRIAVRAVMPFFLKSPFAIGIA
jgi:Zn-dependent protease